MIKQENKYILKAQRKKNIKKIIIGFVFLIMAGIIFVTKSGFFIIKKVAITGNPIITGDDVKSKCDQIIGKNILFINKSDLIKIAKENPYVENVTVTKKYPKQVNINIIEKEGIYYVNKGNNKLILNNKLVLLEQTEDLKGRNLVEIKGIDFPETKIGNTVLDDKRIYTILDEFYNIAKNNPTEYKINSIDITDLTNIKVYIGEVEGKLGNDEMLYDKMNKVMHIISNSQIGIKKGYIDVSFKGAPIYFSE